MQARILLISHTSRGLIIANSVFEASQMAQLAVASGSNGGHHPAALSALACHASVGVA